MEALAQGGTEAPAGSANQTRTASSNSGSAADSLPLSVPTTATVDDGGKADAEKRARDIFKKLAKEAGGEDATVENEDGDDDEELDGAGEGDDAANAGEAKADKTASEKKPEKQSDAPTPEALNEAREALVRDSWTLADLEKLPPGRVLELGTKARQRQQAADRFGSTKAQEVAALKAKLAELEGSPNNNPQQGQNAAVDGAAKVAADDPVIKGIKEKLSKLGELASPEAQAAIEDALSHVYTSARSQMNEQVQQQLAQITASTERQMLSAARKSLQSDYPDLKDDAKFADVVKKAGAFAKTGLYGPDDMEKLITDVCKTMFTPGIKDVQRKMLERTKKAKDGQPDVGQQGAAEKAKPLSPEEKSRAILRQMQKGATAQQARRKVLQQA